MALFEDGDRRLHYDLHGPDDGFPVLAIAPGGMRSAAAIWEAASPWNPVTQLAELGCRVIAMDQRNAGRSTAPIAADHGWSTYTADQLDLLDHLGIDRFGVVGMCIGGSYIMGLIDAAPERVAGAVVFQTIGLDDNRAAFHEMFDSWADDLRPDRPEVEDDTWASFRSNMYDAEGFLFTVDDEFVAEVTTPILALMGNDLYHPESSSRRLVELAPNAALVEHWKEPEHHDPARAEIAAFVGEHLTS